MVKKEKIGDKILFLCEMCGLGYLDEETVGNAKNGARRLEHVQLKLQKNSILPKSIQETKMNS